MSGEWQCNACGVEAPGEHPEFGVFVGDSWYCEDCNVAASIGQATERARNLGIARRLQSEPMPLLLGRQMCDAIIDKIEGGESPECVTDSTSEPTTAIMGLNADTAQNSEGAIKGTNGGISDEKRENIPIGNAQPEQDADVRTQEIWAALISCRDDWYDGERRSVVGWESLNEFLLHTAEMLTTHPLFVAADELAALRTDRDSLANDMLEWRDRADELAIEATDLTAKCERLMVYEQSYKDIEQAFIRLKSHLAKARTALEAAHEWVAMVEVSKMPGVGDTQTDLCVLLDDAIHPRGTREIREGERDART